jgi:hypothetical protein
MLAERCDELERIQHEAMRHGFRLPARLEHFLDGASHGRGK